MKKYKTSHGTITQKMSQALKEPIERVIVHSDIYSVEFLELYGGAVAIYSPTLGQAHEKRFGTVADARDFVLAKRLWSGWPVSF